MANYQEERVKGCVPYIFASLFFVSKRAIVKQGKMLFT